MSDESPQTSQGQYGTPEQPLYVPPTSPSSQRPSDRSRIQPTYPSQPTAPVYPSQPQPMPYQPYYQPPAQQSSPAQAYYNPFRAEFWRDMSTLKISLVTVVSTLLLVTMCVVPSLLAAHGGTSSVDTGGALQPTATMMPTLPPQPTNTPKPTGAQPIDAPTLGGQWSNFENMYGSELNGQQDTWGATIAGQQVEIMVDFSHESDSADGQPRAAIINLIMPTELVGQEIWSRSTANAIAHAFLPTDAKYVNDLQVRQGWVDHTERSTRLAASFTAGIFTTEDGSKTVTPGDLHWYCDLTTQLSNCYVSVGTSN